MNARIFSVWMALISALLVMASPAMAGQYAGSSYGEIDLNTYYSNYASASAQPGINPGINQRPTGSTLGDGSFSNSVAQGAVGNTGVWASCQSSGSAGLIPAGSEAISSDSNLSQMSLIYSKTGIVAFDVNYSLQTSVQVTSPYEFGVDYADIKVYVNNAEVFSTSSTASSFGTGVSQSTGSSETTALMAFYTHPGLNTIEVVTYTNGYVYSVSPPPPPPVPEPSSIVMLGIGGVALVGLAIRRSRSGSKP